MEIRYKFGGVELEMALQDVMMTVQDLCLSKIVNLRH